VGAIVAAAPAAAQILPLVSTIPAPPFPAGPVSQSLGGAYRAIVRAGLTNPSAAERASFLYAQARERARRGDVAGALASSAAAQAAAGSPASRAVVPLTPSEALPAPGLPPTLSVPLADSAAALPADLLVARNEIELAERLHAPGSLDEAKRRYRSALDAYLSGNAAKEATEARASFDLSAEVLSKAK
jgi:hypothetical protein